MRTPTALVIVFLFSFQLSANSLTGKADSIWQTILEQENLSQRLEVFHQQVSALTEDRDTTSLRSLLAFARVIIDNEERSLGEGAVYLTLGAIEQCRGHYDDAIYYYGNARDYYSNKKLPILLFDAVDKQTDLLYAQKDYEHEAESWFLTINILKRLPDKAPASKKAGLIDLLIPAQYYYAASLHNGFHYEDAYLEFLDLVSTIDSSKKNKDEILLFALKQLVMLDIRFDNYSKALKRSQQLIELSKTLKDTLNMAVGYMHMGEIHFTFSEIEQGRHYKKQAARLAEAKGDTLSALKRYLLGSDSTELKHNLQRAETYCRNHNLQEQLLTFWYYYGSQMLDYGNLEEGYQYAEKILASSSSAISKKLDYSYNWANKTRLLYWIKNKNYAKVLEAGYPALADIQAGKDISEEIQTRDYLAKAHTALNQPAEAAQHLRTMLALRDTLYERANNKDFIRIQAEYEYEQEKRRIELKNEQERQLIQAKLKQQRLVSAFVAVALLLLSGLLLTIYRNYRDKAKAAQILEMQKQQLVLSNQKLDRFAHSISHDILSNIDLLLSTGNILVEPHHNPSSLQHYYRQSKQTLSSTKDYCLQLLKSARERDGQATQEADTNSVLQQALEHNKLALDTYNPEVTYDALPPLPISEGDLLQVFQNLLSNAIAFAGPQPDGRIAIRTENTPSEIRIGVLDNGPGIPEDQLESVFEQGVSFKQGGNGQGLAFVRDIVESYGGRVWAERSALGGAGFWIAFPALCIAHTTI